MTSSKLQMKRVFNKYLLPRYLMVVVAIVITITTLFISSKLVKELSAEEYKRMKIWVEATNNMIAAEDDADLNLIVLILESNNTIPVILYDETGNHYSSVNLEIKGKNEQEFLKKKAEYFKEKHATLTIKINNTYQYVYYGDSRLIQQLQIYPFILLFVMLLFISLAIFTLLSAKKREHDKVWIGLTKETAHQLGTPLSSLMAWVEILKLKNIAPEILDHLSKDVERLQMVSERFSKIGSETALYVCNVVEITQSTLDYLSNRLSKKIDFRIKLPPTPVYVSLNTVLYSWVIENIIKNAADTMEGVGRIELELKKSENSVIIDISDTGKGIHKSKFKTIFKPGYTTKLRGWGFGLSLTKRIIESYHCGKVYVLQSTINKGTTMRIELPLQDNSKLSI